jgi:hypothetical protein
LSKNVTKTIPPNIDIAALLGIYGGTESLDIDHPQRFRINPTGRTDPLLPFPVALALVCVVQGPPLALLAGFFFR